MTITSQHNQKLKEIRKLRQGRRARDRAHRFVAEGEDLLTAADAYGWHPVERYCAAGSGLSGIEVEPRLLAAASGLASGTRALAVYEERWAEEPLGPVCLYLHGVHDPGNVGTLLRSAQAFGVNSVTLGPGSADPFSPKAVRASMGAIFAVPVAQSADIRALPGVKIALVPGEGAPLAEVVASSGADLDGAHTLLVGSEREGLSEALRSQADLIAHIPIQTDSLNAAMAATVALYELQRNRRMAPR